jgi:hypothetical protein
VFKEVANTSNTGPLVYRANFRNPPRGNIVGLFEPWEKNKLHSIVKREHFGLNLSEGDLNNSKARTKN